jgi:2-amino-4-hydroxy-6-hydroxymethyldihydropteridine diphosphokinase
MSQTVHRVCLLLGSNIQPETNLPRAISLLQGEVTILQASAVWETLSVGSGGPNFLNAALLVSTSLPALSLKQQVLRPLEARLGRVRTADKNAARPIDLDIILYDGQLMDPALWQHAHRAVPVAELMPDLRSETGETLEEVASRLAIATEICLRPDVVISNLI